MINNSIADATTPTQFFLSQNYPNPFKEKSLIKYCVPLKTKVHIAIYNVQGEKLRILVNKIKNPGTYETEINLVSKSAKDKSPLTDGYYFYQMTTEEFSSEKKWFCINNEYGRLTMKTLIQTLFFFLLVTHICFGQWTQVGLNGEVIKDIAVQNQKIFAVTADTCSDPVFPYGYCFGRLFFSSDNGVSWTTIVDSLVREVAISSTGNILVIKYLDSLFLSSDNGMTWVNTNIGIQLADSFDISRLRNVDISPSGIVFCDVLHMWSRGRRDGIGMSTNGGLEWYTPSGFLAGGASFDFLNQTIITVGNYYGPTTSDFQINLSSDNGLSWNLIRDDGPPGGYAIGINLFSNSNIIHLSEYEIHMTSLGDSTWTQIATLSINVGLSWRSSSSEGLLVGTNEGVFLFSDIVDSLGARNEGLTNLSIHSLSLDNNGYVYAGTENGIWRRPLSEVTSVENETTQPTEFILEQNYPNPFNPSTVISYQLPVSSDVTINVYDILGNEIATLVDEYKPAGKYEIEFDGNTLPSGVYFYQLKAGEFIQTRKMILLK